MNALVWFWWLLLAACVVWYLTMTVYVSIRGAIDIKHMLGRLAEEAEGPEGDRHSSPPQKAET